MDPSPFMFNSGNGATLCASCRIILLTSNKQLAEGTVALCAKCFSELEKKIARATVRQISEDFQAKAISCPNSEAGAMYERIWKEIDEEYL